MSNFNQHDNDRAAHVAALAVSAAPSQTGILTHATAARQALLDDAVEYVRFTNAGAVAYTIPANKDVPFPINSVIEFEQAGAGIVTVAGASGVTINSRGAILTTAGQFAVAALRKTDTDTWTLTGDIA